MKIGFSGMWLHSGRDSKNSGLSRYASCLLEELLPIGQKHRWDVYHPPSFTVPATWKGASFHEVRTGSLVKRVLWEGFTAARIASRQGHDVWFSAAQTIPFRKTTQRVVMVHDIIPLLFPKYHSRKTVLYYSYAIGFAARNADLIFTNSESTKNDLVSRFGADPRDIVVTPLGPGNQATEPSSPGPVIPFDRYLLTVGNLEPRRNLGRLYEALKIIRKDVDIGLVVVGGKRPGTHQPDGGLAELGLTNAVHFPGYVADEDLPALFRNAELFVYPSLYEGFGMPVLESLAMGLPVAASNRAAIPEVGGDAALYFNPEFPVEIAKVVLALLDDPARRAHLSAAGKERARLFTWHNTASRTLAALENL